MRAVRVIPCLDVDAGRVVKGVKFRNLRDAGDPVELAARYDDEGADELVFYDITASAHGRDTMVDVVARTAEQVFIPLTVGGGVRTLDDARRLLRVGADKVSVNSAAVGRAGADRRAVRHLRRPVRRRRHRRAPGADAASRSTPTAGGWRPGSMPSPGRRNARRRGAGEVVLNSMDRDGTRHGFDLELTRQVVDTVGIPVVASGGVGRLEHLVEGAVAGGADAVLAASIFHFGEATVAEAKARLAAAGVPVRPVAAGDD